LIFRRENTIGRPRKNLSNLVGRAGRNAIERENLERDAQRWARRQEVLAKYAT